MRYIELVSNAEIKAEIERIKREYRDLSKIFIPQQKDETIRGAKIITLFRNLDPILKVEADNDLLNKFIEQMENEKLSY
ncbi:MAG: hypothetical protein U5P10_12425 [Spirochaetia bacterium]|nr:hypothetical protein [Spirochaetia bacterium]